MRAETMITAPARFNRPAGGFTLIELMFVVVILAIFLTIGIPEMTEFIADQRVRTTTSDIAAEIAFARAKAVENSRHVFIEKLGASWSNGWRIHGLQVVDATKIPPTTADIDLKRFDGFPPGRMYVCSTVGDFATNIEFRPDGRIVRITPVAATDGIYVIDKMNGVQAKMKIRALLFGLSGRVTIVKMNGTLPPC